MTTTQAIHASVKLRPGHPIDAQACGRICYDALAVFAPVWLFVIGFIASGASR